MDDFTKKYIESLKQERSKISKIIRDVEKFDVVTDSQKKSLKEIGACVLMVGTTLQWHD